MKSANCNSSGDLEIVVLSCNRPSYLLECIESILRQDMSKIGKLIISDNSSNLKVETLVARQWPFLEFRRYPHIPADKHFQDAIRLSSLPYLMLFHDDDILLPGCIERSINKIKLDGKLSAVACNAYYLYENKPSKNTLVRYAKNDFQIHHPSDLIRRYLNHWEGGIAPFPCYIYRRSCIQPEYFDSANAGKHCDVALLLHVLSHGPFLWMSKPLALYRVHPKSDSSSVSLANRLSLIRYLHINYSLSKRSFLALNAKSEAFQAAYKFKPTLLSLAPSSRYSRQSFIRKLITRVSIMRIIFSWRYCMNVFCAIYAKVSRKQRDLGQP